MGKFDKISEQLKNGAVGLLPTDTIYGLSCLALDEMAVGRIYQLKERNSRKPCIILLAGADQAAVIGIDPAKLQPATKHWPAALTVIVPAPAAPQFLTRGTKSLAVRVPADKELRQLLEQTGPLVSSSANLEGQTPARTAADARRYFGDNIDFYIDAGEMSSEPSTIAKIVDGKLEVIRPGAYKI